MEEAQFATQEEIIGALVYSIIFLVLITLGLILFFYYSRRKIIEKEVEKVKNIPGDNFYEKRKESLKKTVKESKDKTRIKAPMDFNPHLPYVGKIFQKHHKRTKLPLHHNIKLFLSFVSSNSLFLSLVCCFKDSA